MTFAKLHVTRGCLYCKVQALIEQGPYYICTVCHRLLYRKSVVTLNLMAYELRDIITDILSFHNEKYICKTCHNKLRKNKKPCQAVCNKVQVFDDPEELKVLNRLETILIAQCLCFQKILIMSKGQQRKIRGAVCNVPLTYDAVCNSLPRPPSSCSFIMVKLKRKLELKGHCYFQAVTPTQVISALRKLKEINSLYQSIDINESINDTCQIQD